MSFIPTEFLVLCKRLQCKEGEATVRTIISRAYYSVFLHAREYLKEKEGISFSGTAEDHAIVEKELMTKVSRFLGSSVRTLREMRNAADYDLKSPTVIFTRGGAWKSINFDKNDEQESIKQADFVISKLPRV